MIRTEARRNADRALKALGANVRRYRDERGETQAGLGQRAGLTSGTIGHLERGALSLSFEHVAAIAWALGVSLAELVTEMEKAQR